MKGDWESSSRFKKNIVNHLLPIIFLEFDCMSFKIHLYLFYRYDSMFIKDLVMWRHYDVILENRDIATRSWQRLAISDNLNRLTR
jgi:hypothetical protein